jgi:hypothetical protein
MVDAAPGGEGEDPRLIDCLAFPSHGSMGEVAHEGMFLRDYFAARAMEAILIKRSSTGRDDLAEIANWAYRIADAMLRRRGRA